VVEFDAPRPCVTVEQHTHKHRTANYGTRGTPPTHISFAPEAPSTTSSAKMGVLSPMRSLTSATALVSRTICRQERVQEAPAKAGAGVLPALRHHLRRADHSVCIAGSPAGTLQVVASPGILQAALWWGNASARRTTVCLRSMRASAVCSFRWRRWMSCWTSSVVASRMASARAPLLGGGGEGA
jgi:hypothetical protein